MSLIETEPDTDPDALPDSPDPQEPEGPKNDPVPEDDETAPGTEPQP